ncbi:MAG: hypothetical protein WCA15_01770 [Candidatus Acidiferrales bacterium]
MIKAFAGSTQLVTLILVALMCSVWPPAEEREITPTLVLKGARLTDETGRSAIDYSPLVIEGDKIRGLGETTSIQVPKGAELRDMRSKIMPELIEVHGHLGLTLGVAQELHLRGGRFKPLVYDQMTPEQKIMTDDVLRGERGSMNGPYNVLLRSPEMGDLAQKYGAYLRFHSSVPRKLNEFAILITARHWNSQYEWYAHHKYGLQAGLNPEVIAALAVGKRPSPMEPDEEIVYNFCTELLDAKQVSDATFEAAKEKLGERGVVDLIGVVGYYQLVSMLLNVDGYPLPDDAKPELKPLD